MIGCNENIVDSLIPNTDRPNSRTYVSIVVAAPYIPRTSITSAQARCSDVLGVTCGRTALQGTHLHPRLVAAQKPATGNRTAERPNPKKERQRRKYYKL